MLKKYTWEEIEKVVRPDGGYDQASLAKLGVNWPPAKGWKKRLLKGLDPNDVNTSISVSEVK